MTEKEIHEEGTEDVSYEEVDESAEIKKLKEKLKEAQEQGKEYLDGWQKERAQFVNLRKQDEKDRQDFAKRASEDLVTELLPVLESFDMAMGNKEAWEKADENWRKGVEYIYNQLKGVLEVHGLKELNPLKEKYDPMRDEAVGHEIVSDEAQEGCVVKVVTKGYSLGGRTLKAPKVLVGERGRDM